MKSSSDDSSKLEKITIAGTTFLVDRDREELREKNDSGNRIPFEALKARQTPDGISILFDKLSKNLYRGFSPSEGVPPMTELVLLSSSLLRDTSPKISDDSIRQWQQGDWNKQEKQAGENRTNEKSLEQFKNQQPAKQQQRKRSIRR